VAAGKKGKTRAARGASKGAPPPPRVSASAKAERRAVKAVRLVRQGKSLTAAAKAVHADPRTVKKYARVALRRKEGTYRAVTVDQMRRPLRVLTDGGLEVVDVRSSRTASRIARYWAAVDHYLRTGDRRRLQPFAGRGFRAGGQRRAYVTDPHLLEQLANAGEVRFEDLYETTA
jgi:hypothetical protein